MSGGDLDAMSCAMWGRGAAPQNAVGLLLAMVNLVVHVPFTDLPELRDYKLGELRKQYDYVIVLTPVSEIASCGSSSSKIAAENHRFSNSGSESIPQPPPHQSQTSGSSISTSASTAFHSVLGSMASKTADEAASAAAAEADACGDDAGNQQYGDPWDTDQAAVALRLLRAEDNRKSPTPAHATPAAKGAPSTNEVARQPVYEAAFDLRRKQREPEQGLDRMVQSPVPLIPGLQQQQLAGPLHPVPSSCSSSEVSLVPGRRGGITGQPSLRDACCPGPPPHQGSSGSISVSSSVQLQPTPTPRGSSGSDGGRPSVPIPATGYQGLAFKQASAADKTICQNDPLPCARSSISENTPAAPIGAVAVKRNIHAGVKVRHSESVRRPRHGGHRNKAEPMALAPVLLNMFSALNIDHCVALENVDDIFRAVGGGSAGCVIANRLSADPDVSVLLLEAGGLETASRQIPAIAGMIMGGHDDWAYWTVPQKNACLSYWDQRCPLPRGKVLGGSSVINAMLYVRGNRHDYDRWEREYGAEGWAYEDVLPHFRDIEDYRVGQIDEYHAASGEVPVDYANTSTPLSDIFLEACCQAGYAIGDYNGPKQSGCSRLQTNVKEGERVSAWKAFIQPIIGTRENLHVAPFSQATKVIFEGSRAVGVAFTRFGEPQNVSARLEVIVSAGAVGSAQLLLLSGVGPKEDLERLQIPVVADLAVGRSLQDHPLLPMAVQTSTDNVGIPSFSLRDIAEYDSNRSGTISIPAGIEALQFLSSENAADSDIPDIEVTLTSSSPATEADRAQQLNLGILPEDYDSYYGPRLNEPGFRVSITNNRPKSRGHITLRSTDPNEYPDINPGIFQHPEDIKVAAQGTRVFIDSMLSTNAMKSIGAKPWGVTFSPCAEAGHQWSLGYIECLFRHWAYPSWHTCCSVPMGSHTEAVLDERLRVRGNVTGLRVADASVMPDIVSGNTNAPSMMIGNKAAEMIIQDNAL
ncbi:hypothetical protein HPB49_013921 [Dermacentor silvarum]|uniref:Uncharacterized protein n=1 Tax=Dermacentor silvarum TaxID=543639 RepID=A0ACB8DDL6_DERSI|nr:hypothetical protein HPB49_013921 [Dermacentor silvarum]